MVGGLVTGSLALISDAAHMGTDVLGLGLALAAIYLAKRSAAGQRTYGTYRLEVLAAVIDGLLLFGVASTSSMRRYNGSATHPRCWGCQCSWSPRSASSSISSRSGC